ncbi:putative gamma-secretase subunit PEN-2 [Vitis vinifera]|nr:putative gamma-secretase subunit PEN-2 [Vitis vinifera]
METGNNPNSSSATAMSNPGWPTIDGPLGLSEEESVAYARRFFRFGFCLLPWLWALNCFYFWPVLLRSRSFPRLRPCNSLSFSAFCLFFFIFSRPISRISGF